MKLGFIKKLFTRRTLGKPIRQDVYVRFGMFVLSGTSSNDSMRIAVNDATDGDAWLLGRHSLWDAPRNAMMTVKAPVVTCMHNAIGN